MQMLIKAYDKNWTDNERTEILKHALEREESKNCKLQNHYWPTGSVVTNSDHSDDSNRNITRILATGMIVLNWLFYH